jgi:hypothetical protein
MVSDPREQQVSGLQFQRNLRGGRQFERRRKGMLGVAAAIEGNNYRIETQPAQRRGVLDPAGPGVGFRVGS